MIWIFFVSKSIELCDIEFWKCYFHKFVNLKQFTRDKLNKNYDVECDLIMGGIAIVIKASKYWIRDWKWTIQDYVSMQGGQKMEK